VVFVTGDAGRRQGITPERGSGVGAAPLFGHLSRMASYASLQLGALVFRFGDVVTAVAFDATGSRNPLSARPVSAPLHHLDLRRMAFLAQALGVGGMHGRIGIAQRQNVVCAVAADAASRGTGRVRGPTAVGARRQLLSHVPMAQTALHRLRLFDVRKIGTFEVEMTSRAPQFVVD